MLELLIGLALNAPVGDTENITYEESPSLIIKTGRDFYGWGELSKGKNYLLGQPISKSYNFSVGVGYTIELTSKLDLFVDAGIGYTRLNNNHDVQQEVTYTYLVGRHNVYNRPIPVTVNYPYDQDSYKTEWSVDYGLVGKIGINYELTNSWSTFASYKYYNPKGYVAIWDQDKVDAGGGWWEEDIKINMSVLQLGLTYKF